MLPTEDLELDERKYLILDFLKKCSSPRIVWFVYPHPRARRCSTVFSGLGSHGGPCPLSGNEGVGVQMPRYVSLTGMQDADGLLSKAEGGGLCLAASGH